MDGYSNYENTYGNGEYEEAYEDAYAYEDCEVVCDDAYSCANEYGALDDAYTDYSRVHTGIDAYGDADYDEPYYDALDCVEITAVSGNLCESQVAQSSEAQQQSPSLDTLQASLIAYVVSELREGIRQTFSALVPCVATVYPSVPCTHPYDAYLTQPSVSKANEARLFTPSTFVEGSVNSQTTPVAMPLSSLEISREAVEQSDIFEEELSHQYADTNTQSCNSPLESVQPTPPIHASRRIKRKRSYSWSGFPYKTMVNSHTQTENDQVDPQVDSESGFDDTNNSFGQDDSLTSPVEPTTSNIRTYAEVVKGAIDSQERVTSKNSLALV